ncbi:hypothetical protein D3C85_833450 [compost metagenome]
MAIEQFVVECAGRWCVAKIGVGIRRHQRTGLAVERVGSVGDIVQEGMSGEQGIARNGETARDTLDEHYFIAFKRNDLRESVRPWNELAIEVGRQQRDVADVAIRQLDTQHLGGLGLDLCPGWQAADAIEHAARGHRIASGIQLVLAQEHLVRCMGRIGLVLIDKGCGRVERSTTDDVVRGSHEAIRPGRIGTGAGEDHEVGGTPRNEEGVIRLQRNEDEAVAALGHQVQAMVEELAEQREPGVEAGG